MSNEFKGSTWHKWDLHAHTPVDPGWLQSPQLDTEEQKQSFAKDYIRKAKEEDLRVVAITNHNFCNRIEDSLLPYIIREGKAEDITVLPGFEISAKDGSGVHLLVIFPEDIRLENIKHVVDQLFAPGVDKLPRNGIIPVSNKNLVEIKRMIEEAGLESLFIFAHADRKNGILSSSTIRGERRVQEWQRPFIKICQLSKDPEEFPADSFIGKVISGEDENYRRGMTFVTASDCRTLDNSLVENEDRTYLGEKFTWIKAEPTFEGLRQIVHEPELRAKIQKENPAQFETYPKIEKCAIDFPPDLKIKEENNKEADFCFQGKKEIDFSNNTTCIIGGHGTGKSTLLHILYNKIVSDGKLFEIDTPLSDFILSPNPLDKLKELTEADAPSNVEFFFQGEIDKKAKKPSEMTDLITRRLETLPELQEAISKEKEKLTLSDFKQDWEKTYEELQGLRETVRAVQQINDGLEKLKRDRKGLIEQKETISSEEYKSLQRNIKEISEKISSFSRYQRQYENLISKIDSLLEILQSIEWGKDSNEDVLIRLEKEVRAARKELKGRHKTLTQGFDDEDLENSLEVAKGALEDYLRSKGQSEENVQNLSAVNEEIGKIEEETKLKDKDLQFAEKNLDEQEDTLLRYQQSFEDYFKFYRIACDLLEKRLSELKFAKEKIKFEIKRDELKIKDKTAQFAQELATQAGLDLVGLKRSDFRSVLFEGNGSDLEDLAKSDSGFLNAVESYPGAEKHKETLKTLLTKEPYLKRLHLFFLQECYSLENRIIQTKLGENRLLQDTSFGERCKIVIAIILAAGTNPIVIDQPEDNLDGKFISESLVPLIRKVKQDRQTVFVTRDANIVVGGDSELIHVLKSEEGETKILSGTIENKILREDYINMLEGGKQAFEKRESKYNLGQT